MEKILLLQADALELDFGTDILEELVGEPLTTKGQSVRLFDSTTHLAEVFYPGGHNGKPTIHNHADGSHWFPITAYMEYYGLSWKQAVTRLTDQYLGDGITPDIAQRIQRQKRRDEQPQTIPSLHDATTVARSLSPKHYADNYFARYLRRLFGTPVADELLQRFNVGSTHWHVGGTVFWQQDTKGNYRAGKIIAYSEPTGKRRKEDEFMPRWAHEVQRLPDFQLVQCLFGEHQLPTRPDAPVGIVESEKTAIVLTALLPATVWLATGGQQNLGLIERCPSLAHRSITLWPDLDVKFDCYTLWEKKAEGLRRKGFDVEVSQLLKENATVSERIDKMDLADFLAGPDKRCPDTGRLLTDEEYPQLWDVADLPGKKPKLIEIRLATVINETGSQESFSMTVDDEQPISISEVEAVIVSQATEQNSIDRLMIKNPALMDLMTTLNLIVVDPPNRPVIYETKPKKSTLTSLCTVTIQEVKKPPTLNLLPDTAPTSGPLTFHKWQQQQPYFRQMGLNSLSI